MNRSSLAALLAFLLLLTGLAVGRASILLLAVPVLVYLLAGIWRAPARACLHALRELSAGRVLAGDEVTVTLTVTNGGAATLEEVLLEDRLPDGLELVDGSLSRLVSLPAGGSASWSYVVRGRRGYYSLNGLRASAGETLGLLPVEQEPETDGRLFVLPPVLRLRRVSIRPRRTRVYSGIVPARQGGPGVEFFDVRPYQSSDSSRQINWRVTARRPGELFTNQYEQERVVDVGLVLDGRARVNTFGERSLFEHSVLAAAALADAFLSGGNRVGLLSYGNHIHWTMPGYGKRQGERILQDLSRLTPGDSQVFGDLFIPKRLFPPRSQLVVISPLRGDDFPALSDLRARGYEVLVISPDPIAFEVTGLARTPEVALAERVARLRRQVLLQRLRGIGIQLVDWDTSLPFEQAARRSLERRAVVLRGMQ